MADQKKKPTTPEAKQQRMQESMKLEFEWHKQMTTLISGIAVALLAVVQAYFTDEHISAGIGLLALCFGILGAGLIASVLFMSWAIHKVRTGVILEYGEGWRTALYPLLCLLGALGFFVAFAYSGT